MGLLEPHVGYGCGHGQTDLSNRRNLNPSGSWPRANFPMNHGVLEPSGRRLHITGQVAWDEAGAVVHPGDAGAQTRHVMTCIARIIEAAGGTLNDLVSITTYYVDQADYAAITDARREALSGTDGPATTGIRIAGLVDPALLVEISGIAVVPDHPG